MISLSLFLLIFYNNTTNIVNSSTPIEINNTNDLSVLNSDSLPTLNSNQKNKIRALLVAKDDVTYNYT